MCKTNTTWANTKAWMKRHPIYTAVIVSIAAKTVMEVADTASQIQVRKAQARQINMMS